MEILLIANHPDELDDLILTDQLVSPVEGLGEGVYLVSNVECDYYVYNYTLPGNGDIQSQLCILA